jgi:hypothetical protein
MLPSTRADPDSVAVAHEQAFPLSPEVGGPMRIHLLGILVLQQC